MKKIFFLIAIAAIVFGANFFLREKHIKEVESTISSLEKELSDIGITLGISNYRSSGLFFWNVTLEVEGEIYGTVSDSVLYFYIPSVIINTKIDFDRRVTINALFPNKINGHLDLNNEVASQLKVEPKYKLFIQTRDIPVAKIHKEGFYGNSTFTLDLNEVSLEVEGQKPRETLIAMDNLEVQSNDITSDQRQFKAKIHNLNIYLDPDKFGKYLPKSISFDSGSKNIEWALDLLITDKINNDSSERIYSGNMDCITKAFEIKVNGEDRAIKPQDDRKYHKSDLNFNIKNFDVFMDYSLSLMLNSKETEAERKQVVEVNNLFRKSIKQYGRQSGDITSFRIKDTDEKKTLFEGIPIDEAFKEAIDKLKEIS